MVITERQDGLLIVGTEGRALEVESVDYSKSTMDVDLYPFSGAFTRQVHQHQRGQGGEVQPDSHPGPENQPHSRGRLQLLQGAGRQNFVK